MAAVTYTATRSLIAGHTAGVEYDLDIPLASLQRSTREIKETTEALSGTEETLLHRIEVQWACGSSGIDEADMPALREFLDSTAGGEAFTFDAYGSVATADDPRTCIRQGNGTRENRIGMTRKYRVSFSVKES